MAFKHTPHHFAPACTNPMNMTTMARHHTQILSTTSPDRPSCFNQKSGDLIYYFFIFTFYWCRSCYNQITEISIHRWHYTLNNTGQTCPRSFNAEKSSSGDNFKQGGSVQCIVFFNLVKFSIHLKKITYLKKFSLKRNWEKMKNLDSFCKSLSAYQVNFSVQTWEGKISACFSLNLDYPDW